MDKPKMNIYQEAILSKAQLSTRRVFLQQCGQVFYCQELGGIYRHLLHLQGMVYLPAFLQGAVIAIE